MRNGPGPGVPRVLRTINDRAALEVLLERGPLSRAQIGRLTGVSKPTASLMLSRLEADGLVVAAGTRVRRAPAAFEGGQQEDLVQAVGDRVGRLRQQ
ncbi:MarR family transcriptional regulator, partial [Streptomyces sp. NPDC048551]|uniref:MarR family transcriptional regulator n=1 Tax=Streptomyces sp. NPDC048551 TaxID=3155758 RepID=UPI00343E8EFC